MFPGHNITYKPVVFDKSRLFLILQTFIIGSSCSANGIACLPNWVEESGNYGRGVSTLVFDNWVLI